MANIFSRISGAFVGLVTGILPGFEWSFRQFDEIDSTNRYGNVIAATFGLPFSIIWHSLRGAYEGATKGLNAAIYFPVTKHQEWVTKRNDYNLAEKIRWHFNLDPYFRQRQAGYPFLTDSEENNFNKYLTELNDSDRKAHQKNFDDYKTLASKQCLLTDKKLNKITYPVLINNNNTVEVCEASALLHRIQDCFNHGAPVTVTNKNTNEVIPVTTNNIEWMPGWVSKFIKNVRLRLNPLRKLYSQNEKTDGNERNVAELLLEQKQENVETITPRIIEAFAQQGNLQEASVSPARMRI